ncbi:hypothetical protein BVY02_02385 [bacterium J17]|nr:hypothetical protein BVY02_02385 [bacterium J17]
MGEEKLNDGGKENQSKEYSEEYTDQYESLLDNIEEKRGSLLKFRLEKGKEELREQKRAFPRKDW